MRALRAYKQILKKKGWYVCCNEVRKRIFRLRWLRSLKVVEAAEEDKVFRCLKKYYKQQTTQSEVKENPYPNKIWICWLQGMENAPHIVKRCYLSIQKHSGSREIIVITENNMSQYVNFPEYIKKRILKKQISPTHISDLIRISLLAEYGGIWLDSTCYLTDNIPDYVTNEPVFMFKSFLFSLHIKASNWFMAAQPNNSIICQTRDMLYEYWRREKFLKHYFIFHLSLSIVVDANNQNRLLWKKMPVFPNTNPHLLQFELFDEYNKERLEQIKNLSFVHKLSYKFPLENFEKKNTFYDIIFNS